MATPSAPSPASPDLPRFAVAPRGGKRKAACAIADHRDALLHRVALAIVAGHACLCRFVFAAAAGALRRVVRGARLAAARAPACADRACRAGESVLLVAPTGGGKTLAGFLPSLIELTSRRSARAQGALHTLYISPLKALAVDVARNLETPVAEMGLDIRIETRTGDTPPSRRQRQRHSPPDILLTTPEQLALLLAIARRAALVRTT